MTDKQKQELRKLGVEIVKGELPHAIHGTLYDQDNLESFIEKLVEEVEREALEKIVGLSIEMEGSFNSGFGTALNEIYYRLSDGKFLDEVLEEKDKGTN